MSWLERKIVAVLTLVLGILFAAVLIVLSMRYQAAQQAKREEEEAAAAASSAAAEEAETVRSPYLAMTYNSGSTVLSFALNEEQNWYWVSDDTFPLRPDALSGIISAARRVEPLEKIQLEAPSAEEGASEEGAEEDPYSRQLAEYGLDDPSSSFFALTPEGEELHVLMGKAVTDGEGRYALLNGEKSVVCVISDELHAALQTPIYEMYALTEFPPLTEDEIQSIVIQGRIEEEPEEGAEDGEEGVGKELRRLTTILTATHGERGASWRTAGANVTDAQIVRTLLAELARLQPQRCFDYYPSNEAAALCGLRPAEALLTVRFIDDSGGTAYFYLSVGSPTADGASRFVQVGEDDPTILLTDAADLAALLDIAENGMT